MARLLVQLAAVLLGMLPWAELADPAPPQDGAAVFGPLAALEIPDLKSPEPPADPAAGWDGLALPGAAYQPRPPVRLPRAAQARPASRATSRLYLRFSRLQTDGG